MRKLLLALALALPLFGQDSTALPLVEFANCNEAHPCISSGDVITEDFEYGYYDGCNTCRCRGSFCECTAMWCETPEQKNVVLGEEYEVKPKAQKAERRGLFRKLARWLW